MERPSRAGTKNGLLHCWNAPHFITRTSNGKNLQSRCDRRRTCFRPSVGLALCLASVLIWAVTGPVFQYSETWQLIINTGTTIVTFLMVFLIQNTQNRDGAAIQAKLDELIRSGAAKNAFIGIEHLTEAEVEEFRALCARAKENNERAPGSRRKAVA